MTEESEDCPSCYKINASKNKREFYVDGLIKGTFVTWKVGTGAKNTFITEDIFNEIPPENRPVLEPAKKKNCDCEWPRFICTRNSAYDVTL